MHLHDQSLISISYEDSEFDEDNNKKEIINILESDHLYDRE